MMLYQCFWLKVRKHLLAIFIAVLTARDDYITFYTVYLILIWQGVLAHSYNSSYREARTVGWLEV